MSVNGSVVTSCYQAMKRTRETTHRVNAKNHCTGSSKSSLQTESFTPLTSALHSSLPLPERRLGLVSHP